MSKTKRTTQRYSRRTFLKGAGVTAVGAAAVVAACAPTNVAPAATTAQQTAVKAAPAGAAAGSLMKVTVNARAIETAVDPRWTLAELLRDQLGLTGTKVGCDRGECGSCTVIVDGKAVLACMTLASENAGKKIQTVEGLANGGKMNGLQQAFWEAGAAQCGFCTPGMLMSSTALLAATPKPSDGDAHELDRAPRRDAEAVRGRRAARAVREPLPLHRLPEDRRGGHGRVRPAASGVRRDRREGEEDH
ncbi:MAG: (2Fe-2S)-binding protein [Chloroflexi bacterium]|nr:(2Fe-2S)-binding protein [Chloroflexota bacterium]